MIIHKYMKYEKLSKQFVVRVINTTIIKNLLKSNDLMATKSSI